MLVKLTCTVINLELPIFNLHAILEMLCCHLNMLNLLYIKKESLIPHDQDNDLAKSS